MRATGRRVGEVTLMRALEIVSPFDPLVFFPETTREDWAAYESWLKPRAMDPKTGALLFPVQSYIVRTAHHTVLIDSCVGNHKERPNRPFWHQKSDDTYMRALAALEIAPEQIDYVLCTHLHVDHVGWNTRLENGRWVPTFPNARYVFGRTELDSWEKGHPKFARAALEDSVLPVIAAGQAEVVNDDFALDDQITLEPTPGHTLGHVAVRIASNGERAVMCGDVIHSPVQLLHPEWTAWPDWDPELAKRTRRAFLERYCETDTLVCTAHFPLPSAGHIRRQGGAFGFDDDAGW
jgi:glyoxylase-like metal-dependent hydrolase (beta-lactamase superfamily II)